MAISLGLADIRLAPVTVGNCSEFASLAVVSNTMSLIPSLSLLFRVRELFVGKFV